MLSRQSLKNALGRRLPDFFENNTQMRPGDDLAIRSFFESQALTKWKLEL
jgi:hypothetical protein